MNLIQLLIFFIYFLIGGFLLNRLTAKWKIDLSNKWVWGLWSLKAMIGIFVILIHIKYYPQNDYLPLNQFGLLEYQNLIHHPGTFFTDWLHSPYANKYSGLFQSVGSYWNDLRNTLLSKFIGIANLINRGNIYLNILIFCWIGFIGHLAFFRFFLQLFPSKKIPVLIGSFLLPSTLFFSSALHKDTIIFTLMGCFLYVCLSVITNGWSIKRFFEFISCLLGLFLFRNFVCIVFVPFCLLWIWAERKELRAPVILGISMILLAIFLICADFYFPQWSPVNILADKQADYLNLPMTESSLDLQKLEPDFKSLIQCLPMSLEHAFLRPFLWEDGRFLVTVSAIEIFLYQLMAVLLIFLFHRSPQSTSPGSIWFIVTMAVCLFLFAGYISPNTGTLVRYRCLYLPMLITPALCVIKWRNFGNRWSK